MLKSDWRLAAIEVVGISVAPTGLLFLDVMDIWVILNQELPQK